MKICESLYYYLLSPKEAIKKTAADRNVPKRDVYGEYHGLDS